MRRSVSFFVLGCLLLAMPACRLFKRPKEEQAAATASRLSPIGTITLVNEEDRFVLIDSGSLPAPEKGAILLSYTSGSISAELQATDVRRRPFVIADIRSGHPRKGDRVEMPRFLETSTAQSGNVPSRASQNPGEPALPQ